MTSIKNQIRAEIERLKSLHSPIPFGDNYEVGYSDGYQDCCDSILAFLNILPEQPAEGLEDLRAEVIKFNQDHFAELHSDMDTIDIVHIIARHFAEWGRKQLLQEIYGGKAKEDK